MGRFLTDEGKAALLRAVREVEARSAAEVLVAVRAKSGAYLHADALAALIGALLALAFALYSPFPVGRHAILLDAVLTACGAAWVSSRTPALRRWLSSATHLRRAVEREARATFVDKGVPDTRGRTGLLVYVSQLEKRVCVVADRGVRSSVDPERYLRCVAAIEGAADAGELARALASLGPLLESALPRALHDINELGDEVLE